MKGLVALAILGAMAYGLWSLIEEKGFAAKDIENMKADIKKTFEERPGVAVQSVVMMKESPRKAVGFVKLTAPILGELTKPCSATMAEDGKTFMWRCE